MKKILIIDDDPASRQAIRSALAEWYQVVDASGGQDGIAQLESQLFDLVICDVIMPDIDGLEIVRHIRSRDANLPIVIISGGGRINSSDYLRIGVAFGAQKSLAKPIRVRELRHTVAALIDSEVA